MRPCETWSTAGSNSTSSSTLGSLLTNLCVEMNWISRRSADEAERSAGIVRLSGSRDVKLNEVGSVFRSHLSAKSSLPWYSQRGIVSDN